MDLITMSERELQRIEVLSEVLARRRSEVSAAAVLGLSTRQTRRLLRAYRDGGGGALIHKSRGRGSNNRLVPGIREYAIELIRSKYADFGPTLATEMLLGKEALKVSRETLAHCVAPKDLWLADRELTFDWPLSGLPDLVYMDNAKEFHAEALRSAAQEYGIDLEYRPPGLPHFGGHIERLIGTMMGAVHLIPGTTFSNIAERGDYASAKKAVMTLSELERWFALQVHAYHSTIHSNLNATPLTAWKRAVAARKTPIRQMADADRHTFFLDLLPGERRKIRRDGIRLFNIHYWDNVLSPLAGRVSAPVLVKYDPRDLSTIHYQDEQGNYWAIPYRDLGAPPISLWEHRAAESALRAEGKHSFNEAEVFSTVLLQRDIVGAARNKTRKMAHPESIRRTGEPAIRGTEEDDLAQTTVTAFKVEEWE